MPNTSSVLSVASSIVPFLRGTQRAMRPSAPGSAVRPAVRATGALLAAFARDGGRRLRTLRVVADGHREGASFMKRLRQTVEDIYALARDGDPHPHRPTPEPSPHLEAALVEARLLADAWRARAEASESRRIELEARLEASEMAALELRSRIVCLHGKLATSTATVRYQTMTLALEHQAPAPGLVEDTPEALAEPDLPRS